MAAEQAMTQTLTQAVTEATKAVIMAVRDADDLVNAARPVQTIPRTGSPVLKQPTFIGKVNDKY